MVLSQDKFNRHQGFIFVCPISNTKRKNPFYIPIPDSFFITGVIMADQLRSLDYRARNASFISKCSADLFAEVIKRIKPILFDLI